MMAIDAKVLKDRCKKDENYPKKSNFLRIFKQKLGLLKKLSYICHL